MSRTSEEGDLEERDGAASTSPPSVLTELAESDLVPTKRARACVWLLMDCGVIECLLSLLAIPHLPLHSLEAALLILKKIADSIGDDIRKRENVDLELYVLTVSRALMSTSVKVRVRACVALAAICERKKCAAVLSNSNAIWIVCSFLRSSDPLLCFHGIRLLQVLARVPSLGPLVLRCNVRELVAVCLCVATSRPPHFRLCFSLFRISNIRQRRATVASCILRGSSCLQG